MGNLIVTTHGGVATVVVDHPPINLMTVDVFLEAAEVIQRLSVDDDVRVVVLRSANPDWFIAHFDVEAILGFPTDQVPSPKRPSAGDGSTGSCRPTSWPRSSTASRRASPGSPRTPSPPPRPVSCAPRAT